MPQISTQEFERLPLRVHDFLAGLPLHDAWAVDLPRPRSGITLSDFLRKASAHPSALSPLARLLVNIRRLRPRTTPFQHGQLLSQREFLKDEIPAVTEEANDKPN